MSGYPDLKKIIEDLSLFFEQERNKVLNACQKMYKHAKNLMDLNNRFVSRNKKNEIKYQESNFQYLLDIVSFYNTHINRFLDLISGVSSLSSTGLSIEEYSQAIFDMILSLYIQLWIIYQQAFQSLHTVHRYFLTKQDILRAKYSFADSESVLSLGKIAKGGIIFDVDKAPIHLRILLNINQIRNFIQTNVLNNDDTYIEIEDIFDSLIYLVGWRNQLVHPLTELRMRHAEPLSISNLLAKLGFEIPRLVISMNLFLKFLFKETEWVAKKENLLIK